MDNTVAAMSPKVAWSPLTFCTKLIQSIIVAHLSGILSIGATFLCSTSACEASASEDEEVDGEDLEAEENEYDNEEDEN